MIWSVEGGEKDKGEEKKDGRVTERRTKRRRVRKREAMTWQGCKVLFMSMVPNTIQLYKV